MNDPTKQDESKTNIFEFLDSNPWIAIPLIIVLGVAVNVLYHWIFDAGEQQQWVQRTFADGEFQISVPDSWEPGPELGDLFLADEKNRLIVLAVVTLNADIPDDVTLAELSDQLVARDKRTWIGNGKSLNSIIAVSRADNTIDVIITGAIGGDPVWCLSRYVNHDDLWVMVQVLAPRSGLEQHQKTLEQIVDSVRPTR